MKRLFIFTSFFLLVIASGCRSDSAESTSSSRESYQPKGGLADLVYNPVRPDGSIDSSFLPILTWHETVYDFGTVFEGDIITKEYFFTNTGTAPLLIYNATSTCGCTVPVWPKDPVAPDSTGSIEVKFNTLDKRGAQNKEVTIFANTFPNQTRIFIQGNVEINK